MASNQKSREEEAKHSRGGGKMTTKRSNQDAPKPYDRRLSTFGRFCAAVKDILKPALVTDAMSRLNDTQKEQKKRWKEAELRNAGSEILCDNSEFDEVTVEVDGYQAVFKSSDLEDEINLNIDLNFNTASSHARTKSSDCGSLNETSFGQQRSSRPEIGSLHERSSGRFGSMTYATTAQPLSRKSLSTELTGYNPSIESQRNGVPETPQINSRSMWNSNVMSQAGCDQGEFSDSPSQVDLSNEASLSPSQRPFRVHGSSSKKPAFKMSRFCESIEKIRTGTSLLSRSVAEMSALSESCADSSFYAGRTSYGGAASAKKSNPSLMLSFNPYQTRPSVQKCVKAMGVGGEPKVLSVTAQRLLYTMQREDERSQGYKQTYDTSLCNSPLSFTPSYRRNSAQFGGATQNVESTRNNGPPVKPLLVPSVSVLKPTRAKCIEQTEIYQSMNQIIGGEILRDGQPPAQQERRFDLLLQQGCSRTLSTPSTGFDNIKSSVICGKKKKVPTATLR